MHFISMHCPSVLRIMHLHPGEALPLPETPPNCLTYFSFRWADPWGCFCFVVFLWFVLVPSLAVGIRSSDVINLELAALLLWSLYALVACRASLPCSICFTCSVWTLSHSFHSLQRLLVVLVFFVVVGFCVVVVSLVGLVWFFVVFVLPLLLCMPSIFHWLVHSAQTAVPRAKKNVWRHSQESFCMTKMFTTSWSMAMHGTDVLFFTEYGMVLPSWAAV